MSCGFLIGATADGRRCVCNVSRKVYEADGSNERQCCGKHLRALLRQSFPEPRTAIVVKMKDTHMSANLNPFLSDAPTRGRVLDTLTEKERSYYTSDPYLVACEQYLKFGEFVDQKPDLRYYARLYPKFAETEDGSECSICCEPITSSETGGALTRCKHSFHKTCLESWYVPSVSSSTAKCPNCFTFIVSVLKEKKNKRVCTYHKRDLKCI